MLAVPFLTPSARTGSPEPVGNRTSSTPQKTAEDERSFDEAYARQSDPADRRTAQTGPKDAAQDGSPAEEADAPEAVADEETEALSDGTIAVETGDENEDEFVRHADLTPHDTEIDVPFAAVGDQTDAEVGSKTRFTAAIPEDLVISEAPRVVEATKPGKDHSGIASSAGKPEPVAATAAATGVAASGGMPEMSLPDMERDRSAFPAGRMADAGSADRGSLPKAEAAVLGAAAVEGRPGRSERSREKFERDPSRLVPATARNETVPPQVARPSGAALKGSEISELVVTDRGGFELHPVHGSDAEPAVMWESRAAGPVPGTHPIPRAELPVMVGRQLAEAIQRHPDRPVELTLNPQELGRVRLSISTVDGGITVNVLAERQETLDLMRRNIGQLALEFAEIGYADIAFAFAQGGSEGGQKQESGERSSARGFDTVPARDNDGPVSLRLSPTAGLDIRL
ncbi:flagellar hook-length control protein FliK [Sulfitobacter sp. LCG007]